jgi:hypothetical protein
MATVAVLGFRRRRHGVASSLRSSRVPRRPYLWAAKAVEGGESGATAGEAALGGVNGVGAARLCAGVNGGGRVRRWDTTLQPRPGGDQRRRRCAEIAAAVQRQW